MPPKNNPLKLNPLQLRTLTILQLLANLPAAATAGPGPGERTIHQFPSAHGDHYHIGDSTVMGKDITGLFNEKVWHALERKGLARSDWPHRMTLTVEGMSYVTGVADEVLHRGGH
ncbi:MAG: hypothetical protein GC166_00210 [Alphaproteobacteria bacterium]|nr:hypothetical protein [Alphaproteobacteria bacterium]